MPAAELTSAATATSDTEVEDPVLQETSFLNDDVTARRRADGVKAIGQGADDETDTACGYGSFRPLWLQKFARAEVYAVVHGLIGFCLAANNVYNVGTLTTLEKHFKIPSRTNGFIRSAFEIGSMATLPFMGYFARHIHPMYLLSGGTMVVCLSCLCFILPHIIFGAGAEAISYAVSNASIFNTALNVSQDSIDRFCGVGKDEVCEDEGSTISSTTASAIILFIANTLLGVGNSAHFSVGIAYLDNNARKNIAPILLATTFCIHMLGPTLGYAFSAFALSHYIEPSLTPSFTNEDPRWVGAWWMGWPILACMVAVMGAVALCFPRRMPQVEVQQRQMLQESSMHIQEERPSIRDFKLTMKRLLTNKVLMYNILSGICLGFGFEFYLIYMPKYIETQFRQSASYANIVTGSIGLTMQGLGTIATAIVITRFQPHPRTLAAWNVITEILAVLAHCSWAVLGCPIRDLQGSLEDDGSWNLTAACNAECGCGPNVPYTPICSLDGATTYFSPCHGGCNSHSFINGTKFFNECQCIDGRVATDGACPIDCSSIFITYIATQCIVNFLATTGRAGNILLAFRCVDPKDKSLSIALGEISLCLLAFFPAPTVYGALLDISCIVWGVTCGETGNCWLYDEKVMRYLLNFTAAGALLVGTVFDVYVWKHCGDLKMYDEDDETRKKEEEEKTS